MIKNFEDLKVWQHSMLLVKMIYDTTSSFPADERYGLISQMRRCSVSIPSNIAEGHARQGTGEFLHFLSIALGSLAELRTQAQLSVDLNFLSLDKHKEVKDSIIEIERMTRGLMKSLKK